MIESLMIFSGVVFVLVLLLVVARTCRATELSWAVVVGIVVVGVCASAVALYIAHSASASV